MADEKNIVSEILVDQDSATASVIVDNVHYPLIKSGRAQAKQVVYFTKWISKYGIPALEAVRSEGGEVSKDSGLEFLSRLVEYLNDDALIDLFVAVVGCTPEVAEVHFSIDVLIDSLMAVYDGQPALRRIIDRFFSQPSSEEKPEG